MKRFIFALAAVLVCVGAAACRRGAAPRPLEHSAFAPAAPAVGEQPHSAIDQPGVIMPRSDGAVWPEDETPPPDPAAPAPGAAATMPAATTQPLADLPTAATVPAIPEIVTWPATAPVPLQYVVVGAVVAEANGVPIYADRVVRDLEPLLAARAREVDVEQFRALATREIGQRILSAISDELEYAAAQRNLEDRDKQIARAMTEQWRQQQITLAGGSIELARGKFAAEGRSFDLELADQEKANLSRLFFFNRVNPRITVTREEMLRYYERNREAMFTERGMARFRVIRIDPRKIGGPDAAAKALELAHSVRQQAADGADFASLAQAHNSDERYARLNQQLMPIEKGAFAVAAVEEAAWAMEPNDISPVIDGGDAFYIVQLVAREPERIRPFESAEVQAQIEEALRTEQRGQLREQYIAELSEGAMIRGDPRRDPRMMQPAVDIAMQRYPAWRAAK